MIKSGMETSEGKKSLGIIVAICFFIYYILSHKYSATIPIEQLLLNAENAIDIAKTYAEATENNDALSGNVLDTGTIVALLVGVFKTYSKYADGRIELKKEELKLMLESPTKISVEQKDNIKKF